MKRVVLVAVLLAASACSGSSDKATPQSTAAPCPTAGPTASTALPSNVPAIDGTPYDYSAQGKTWFYSVSGSGTDLPALRDAYDAKLTAAGYKILNTDQEAGAESESAFAGPHSGTTNFRPLCDGKVVFRLKLTE